jgi:hypothetical protein
MESENFETFACRDYLPDYNFKSVSRFGFVYIDGSGKGVGTIRVNARALFKRETGVNLVVRSIAGI